MANTVQHKRGDTAAVNGYTGAVGEFIYNTTTKRIHAQDGATPGGIPHALVSDVDLKANASVTISAGTGLTGGGTLAANRTLALSSASIASLALADSAVQPDVLDDYATLAQLAAKFDNPSGTTSQYIRGDGSLATFPSIPQGTVTSVGMTAPTGFSVSGSPVTSTGALALSYAAGYQGYTTAEATKLAGVQEGAQVNAVNSVAGKTGTVTLVKGDVGLGNVDNTSDANKPISTATQAALNAKANSAVTITAGSGLAGGGDLSASRTVALDAASIASLALADSAVQSVNGKTGSSITLTKADVGLSNVDNTSDTNKPISTATQTALNGKVNKASDTGIGGFTSAGHNLGNLSGTVTPVPTATSNFKYASNNAAFTLAAPTTAGYYTIAILVTNAGSGAGAMTATGFSVVHGTFSTDANKKQVLTIEVFGSDKVLTIRDAS